MLWIHASNAARFDESICDTVEQLRIPGRKDAATNMLQLFRSWLWDESKGSWFIVLGNADDVDFLLQPSIATVGKQAESSTGAFRHALFHQFPTCSHGSMLITSRSRPSALRLVEDRDIVIVPPMDIEDAVALLNKKLDDSSKVESTVSDQTEELRKLATALEYMPLALTQAAAYIRRKRPRCSVSRYLGMLQRSEKSEHGLLEQEGGDLRRDHEAKNSIILTWQISFDHLYRVRQSAATILSLMSFFDRQAISESFLEKNEDTLNSKSPILDRTTQDKFISGPEFEFEEDLEALQGYSFTSVNVDSTSFTMHRLVQVATQRWLTHQDQLERWKAAFINRLNSAFPWVSIETW